MESTPLAPGRWWFTERTGERLVTRLNQLQAVVDGGYCIGCGTCAALDPSISVEFDVFGRLQASFSGETVPSPLAVEACPFTNIGPDEDELSAALFGTQCMNVDDRIGHFIRTYAGWVNDADLRERASSGGMGTWLQRELLQQGEVDAVLNVEPIPGQAEAPLFSYSVVTDPKDVISNAKTRYYPVEMSGVIQHMLRTPGRYAVIAIPCFAKALRLAARQSPILGERLRYVLGIVCGHLKSAAFTEALAWQCGIDPRKVLSIDFRSKLEGRPASRYGIALEGTVIGDGKQLSVTRPMEGLVGADWGQGLFKYKACEFCDDVLAETADVVVGDAWLPDYVLDHRGANVIVVRNAKIMEMVDLGLKNGALHLDKITADDVAESQAGGLRHRRLGLAYRLWMTDRAGKWRPRKRVQPRYEHLSPHMRRLHTARYRLGKASHQAWRDAMNRDDPGMFLRRMKPQIDVYSRLLRPSFAMRVVNRVEAQLAKVLRAVGSQLWARSHRRM